MSAPHSAPSAHSYRQRARKLSEIHRDQPGHPVDRTVYWIEYVLRHPGARHLRAAVHQLSFCQYFLLDVASVLALGAAALYFLLARGASLARRTLRGWWSARRHSTANGRPHNGVLNGRCHGGCPAKHAKKAQ